MDFIVYVLGPPKARKMDANFSFGGAYKSLRNKMRIVEGAIVSALFLAGILAANRLSKSPEIHSSLCGPVASPASFDIPIQSARILEN